MAPQKLLTLLAGIAGLTTAGVVLARHSGGPDVETITAKPETDERAGLCPWRTPEEDIKRFFPGATGHRTEILVLSRKRAQILKRLGPGHELEANSLYVYRVGRAGEAAGSVFVKRTAGRYGAIEVVAALDDKRRIVGLRVQRQREPKATAILLTTNRWLDAFRGKDVRSEFRIGEDLPDVPIPCRESAAAVADAVRSILIEYDEGAQSRFSPDSHSRH